MWKKRIQILLWCLLGLGCLVALVAAMQAKVSKVCNNIKIELEDEGQNVFVDTNEISAVLKSNKAVVGAQMENIPLALAEKQLKKNVWVKNAQLFFDNNQSLTVEIAERQPVARIFTVNGRSFYIDSAANILPLSDRHTARVPVFTSFPQLGDAIRGQDSALLQDVKHIAGYIQGNSFWAAQVSQVDITPQHTYEIIPVLGNQVISLGTCDELDAKFKKLYAFYKQVWAKTGFEKYSKIDLQYEGQVVAVKRGVPENDTTQAAGITDSSLALNASIMQGAMLRDSVAHATRRTQPALNGGKKGQKPVKRNQPLKQAGKPAKGKKQAASGAVRAGARWQ